MSLHTMSRNKSLLVSLGAGFSLVLLLFIVATAGVAPSVSNALLSPGLLLAGLVGVGAHDLGAIVLSLLGDTLFYGLLVFLALCILRARK